MIAKYFLFSISVAFSSMILGMMVTAVLKKSAAYERLSQMNWIKSRKVNKRIGLGLFKWVVKYTFFKYFNQKLKVEGKVEAADLRELRSEMTFSEIAHLVGFVAMMGFTMVMCVKGNYMYALVSLVVNILMNLYPSLLQQENKRRIDVLLRRMK